MTALTLTACGTTAPPTDGGTMASEQAQTPEQAQAELVELFTRTAEFIGGGEWTTTEYSAEDCDAGSEQGANFAVLMLGDTGSDDPESTAKKLAAYWNDLGYETVLAIEPAGAARVTHPTRDDGFGIQFGVGPGGMSLDGETGCLPGDADAINEARR
jgi:hypothetical protein